MRRQVKQTARWSSAVLVAGCDASPPRAALLDHQPTLYGMMIDSRPAASSRMPSRLYSVEAPAEGWLGGRAGSTSR